MLGLGIGEIILILIVAIIVLGPDKFPQAVIQVVKFFRAVKKTMQDAKDTIDREVNLSELKREAHEYKEKLQNTLESNFDITKDIQKDIKNAHMLEDIKKDMNDIEHLFSDFSPKIVRRDMGRDVDKNSNIKSESAMENSEFSSDAKACELESQKENTESSGQVTGVKTREENIESMQEIKDLESPDSKNLKTLESKDPQNKSKNDCKTPDSKNSKEDFGVFVDPKDSQKYLQTIESKKESLYFRDSKDYRDFKIESCQAESHLTECKLAKSQSNADSKTSKDSITLKNSKNHQVSKDSTIHSDGDTRSDLQTESNIESSHPKPHSLASSLRDTFLKQKSYFD